MNLQNFIILISKDTFKCLSITSSYKPPWNNTTKEAFSLTLDDHLLLLARQMRAAEEGQNQTKQILLFTTTEKLSGIDIPSTMSKDEYRKENGKSHDDIAQMCF